MDQSSDDIAGLRVTPGGEASRDFVGRERELAELRSALNDARSGHGRFLLIVGEPGIGKTRLCEEFAGFASARGFRSLWGRCHEGEGAPAYWPWVQIVRSFVEDREPGFLMSVMGPGAADIAQVVFEVRERLPDLPQPPALEADQARFRFFDSATRFLRNAAKAEPLLLVLDDLHWVDKPSLLLLQFLAREMRQSRLIVVGAYRQHEISRELAKMLGGLTLSQRVPLAGLREEDVSRVIEMASGTKPPPALARTVHQHTEGNPFFVNEIVRLLAAEGRLERPEDSAHWSVSIPQGIRELIGRRLDGVSEGCNAVLSIASAIGRDFRLDVLARASEVPDQRLLEVLDEALVASLVTQPAPRRYSFSHVLIRDTLYGELGSARRLDLHRRIAEALEEIYAADAEAHLSEIAHHFLEAAYPGHADKALDYLMRAGRRATALLAYEDAAELYQRALQILDLAPTLPERRYELLMALGTVQANAGDNRWAKEAFQKAAAIAKEAGDAHKLADAALGYRGSSWSTGDPAYVGLLEDALEALGEEESALRAYVMERLAVELHSEKRGIALSNQAVEIARRSGDRRALAFVGGWRRWVAGIHPHDADDLGSEIAEVARTPGDYELFFLGYEHRGNGLLMRGAVEEFDSTIDEMASAAEELRLPAGAYRVALARGMRATMAGNFREGEQLAQQAFAIGQRIGESITGLVFAMQMFLLRWNQGRLQELEEEVRRAVNQYPKTHSIRCRLALLYCEIGRRDEARREFELFAANEFTVVRETSNWALTASLLAEICAVIGDAQGAEVLYGDLLPWAGRNYPVATLASFLGCTSRHLGLLAATMSRWDEAERHFEDALEMHARMRARPFLARTQYEYAKMLLARGAPDDREKARELLNQALGAAEDLGMKTVVEGSAASLSQCGETVGAAEPSAAAPDASQGEILHRDGDYWTVSYEGGIFRLRDTKGLQYLAHLLRHPGEEFHVADLVAAVGSQAEAATDTRSDAATPGLARATGLGDAGELLDPQARAEYKQRLEDLRAELDQATEWGDKDGASRLQEEIEFISQELSAAYGLGGRSRKGADTAERIRKAVSNRIRDSIARIEKENRALAKHLAESVRMGAFCSYSPKRSARRS